MFDYIAGQPKGTFTNEQLQLFINMGWLTSEQYNQLAVATSEPTTSATPASEQSSSTPASAESNTNESNTTNA